MVRGLKGPVRTLDERPLARSLVDNKLKEWALTQNSPFSCLLLF